MKLVSTVVLLCISACFAKRGGKGHGLMAELSTNLGSIFSSLGNGMKPQEPKHAPMDHPSAGGKKIPGGVHKGVGPLIPQEAVLHARRYGHFTSKQLHEIEVELTKYANDHHAEIASMKTFRRTLPIDPGMWTKADKKRFDTRYNTNVKRIKAAAVKSRDVAKKWRIPPNNVGTRETTWITDEKHLSMVSEHLWKLAQKGKWTEKQRADFRADLDKYMETEQRVLAENQEQRAKGITPPPTAKTPDGKKAKKILTPDETQARKLRANLENAVHHHRMEL